MEFTTSNLYHFSSQMLIEEFVRLHNFPRVNMFDLNERMSRLEEQVTEMKTQITHLSEYSEEQFKLVMKAIADLKKQ
jgi:hypothetical protein